MCKRDDVPKPPGSTVAFGGVTISMDVILRNTYRLVVALSAFMAFWALIMPASWRIGWDNLPLSALHRQLLEDHFERETANGSLGVVPRSLVFKYEGQTAVQVCHTLASSVWSILLPFQFHKGFRQKYPTWHRWMGRVFLSVSFLMMVGVGIILRRKLLFTQYDYGDLTSSNEKLRDAVGVSAEALWFLYTGGRSLWAARQRRFAEHQDWMIRHASAGLWVALQRIFLNVLLGAATTRPQQCQNFSTSAFLGIGVAQGIAESAIWLLRQQKRQKQASAVKME